MFTVAQGGAHEVQKRLEWLPRTIRLNKRPNSEGEVTCEYCEVNRAVMVVGRMRIVPVAQLFIYP